MGKYKLIGEQFHIEDFEKLPAFSSFLPGLAGVRGVPIWVFYTNRGQGINSFGIHHKGNAIMEFNPANTAYENTPGLPFWQGRRWIFPAEGRRCPAQGRAPGSLFHPGSGGRRKRPEDRQAAAKGQSGSPEKTVL